MRGSGGGMLCAQARCQISCVSSAGADLGWDCEQLWVGTGQALPRSASMKHSPHGHPSLWESCPPSVWLSRDRCGTGKSGAQVRGATTKQPFAGVRLLLSQDECAHGGRSWKHFGANHKQSWHFLGLWGERTQVCFRLTPKCGRGGGHVKHLGSFLPIFLREQACPWRYLFTGTSFPDRYACPVASLGRKGISTYCVPRHCKALLYLSSFKMELSHPLLEGPK